MTKKDVSFVKVVNQANPWSWALGVSYFGAAVYFIQQSHGFWEFWFALIKAAVWPGFVIYQVLKLLGVN